MYNFFFFFKKLYNFFFSKIGFKGKYHNYLDALVNCDGYDNQDLINYVFKKTLEARRLSFFEQDGIIYKTININEDIENFFKIKKNNNISILDVGGSFGKLFFLVRKRFPNLKLDWSILEQNSKVSLTRYKSNKKYFKNINFYNFDQFVPLKKKFDIVIFETSLQYIKSPYQILKVTAEKTKNILIVNLTTTLKKKEYLKIEHPSSKVYNYTYPCWFLNAQKIEMYLRKKFSLVYNKKVNDIYILKKFETYQNLFFTTRED
jgi:hypothetical protein